MGDSASGANHGIDQHAAITVRHIVMVGDPAIVLTPSSQPLSDRPGARPWLSSDDLDGDDCVSVGRPCMDRPPSAPCLPTVARFVASLAVLGTVRRG